jgi:hypothetical protein
MKKLLLMVALVAVASSVLYGGLLITPDGTEGLNQNPTELEVRLVNLRPGDRVQGFMPKMDWTATNVEVQCTHEPVVTRTNNIWVIHFK